MYITKSRPRASSRKGTPKKIATPVERQTRSPERLDQGLPLGDQPSPPFFAHAEQRDEEVQARPDACAPGVALSHLPLSSKTKGRVVGAKRSAESTTGERLSRLNGGYGLSTLDGKVIAHGIAGRAGALLLVAACVSDPCTQLPSCEPTHPNHDTTARPFRQLGATAVLREATPNRCTRNARIAQEQEHQTAPSAIR